MESTLPRPPYDKELGEVLARLKLPPNITPELIPAMRKMPIPAIADVIRRSTHLVRGSLH
jgi:hypothetical protein